MEPANKMRIPLTICDSAYNLRIPLTICGFRNSSMSLYTCLIICLWTPQTVLDSANTVADSANSPIFGAILSGAIYKYLFLESKTAKKNQISSLVAGSATNLILACCGVRLQCTECTVYQFQTLLGWGGGLF